MDEIISILKDPEKINQLILKLQTLGEQSPQFQTFKTSMDSFHLNLPPRGIDQKNILQTVFNFSDPLETFQTFRLVCKSWQNAVETIHFYRPNHRDLLTQMCEADMNHQTRTFFSKYLKCFKKLLLFYRQNFDQTKWDQITNILTTNAKNLQKIDVCIANNISPTKVTLCLFDLFENSQTTLTELIIVSLGDIPFLPSVSLPHLSTCEIYMTPAQNTQMHSFKYLMKIFISNMCLNIKEFKIKSPHRAPNILTYFIENYPQHFVCAPKVSVLEHIPLKISHLKLPELAACRFLSQVEYLILHVQNLDDDNPSEGGWDNYREILKFFPKLKGIILYEQSFYFDFATIYDDNELLPSTKTIWKQRSDYLKSKNIKLLNYNEYKLILSEARESMPTWYFDFLYV